MISHVFTLVDQLVVLRLFFEVGGSIRHAGLKVLSLRCFQPVLLIPSFHDVLYVYV